MACSPRRRTHQDGAQEAAQQHHKHRKHNLELISCLEENVKMLKSQNTELASHLSLLLEQVAQLKQKVLSHVNSGCQLLPQYQVPAY
ncbi:Hypothetical predicted protein [Marmota monax]|uniref:Transcription factor JunD n=1 Tax=Marmota monax TaxID=9995 RepID=A0A5E4D5V6_MARMO|nr:hypothetical protein GHT09_017874 [Marmota monax]VTJ89623.1 Hypothetical predicted protein [Marmota monax]